MLTLQRVGLTFFVERHHDHRRAVALHQLGVMAKRIFAFLHADGVDHRAALHALQARFDDFPFRRIDHHRHPGNVRLGGDEIQKFHHRRLGIEHRLVHVDVDDLRAALHLLARHVQRRVVIAGEYQARKGAGTRYIGTFANVNEERTVADVERL